MKTETPPTPPTIAELWNRFQKLGDYIETEKFLHSWGTKGSDGLSHDGRNHSADEIELQSLRQQLVERCKPWISWNTDGSHYIEPRVVLYNATPNELRKVATVYEFAAWEIEQRQREKEAQP